MDGAHLPVLGIPLGVSLGPFGSPGARTPWCGRRWVLSALAAWLAPISAGWSPSPAGSKAAIPALSPLAVGIGEGLGLVKPLAIAIVSGLVLPALPVALGADLPSGALASHTDDADAP